jgi:PilZ domain-containing protein
MISALGCGAPVLVLLSWVRHVNNGVPSMAYGDRKSERVEFGRGIDVHMMGIDGTWRRDCTMNDVSRTGARLTVNGPIQGLDLKEFFLLLSSTGLAYRRCRMVRLAGDQIGVEFLKPTTEKTKKAASEKRQSKLENQ